MFIVMKKKAVTIIIIFLLASIPTLSFSINMTNGLIKKLHQISNVISNATKSIKHISPKKTIVVRQKPVGEVEEFDSARNYYKNYSLYLQKKYRNNKPIEKPFPIWKHHLNKTYNYAENRWYKYKLRGTNIKERRIRRLWEEEYNLDKF